MSERISQSEDRNLEIIEAKEEKELKVRKFCKKYLTPLGKVLG